MRPAGDGGAVPDQPMDWLSEINGLDAGLQLNLLRSVIAIVIIWAAQKLISRVLINRIGDPAVRYRTSKGLSYLSVLVGFLLVGRIWYAGVESMATFLGLLSAGIAIALRDMVSSFAGWLFLIWRKPFQIGDRIQIGDISGDVIDKRIFQFSLLEIGNWIDADQPTGRIMHIPNQKIFSEPLANYSRGTRYIWHELPVLLTFESDWETAKRELQTIAERHGGDRARVARDDLRRASSRFLLYDLDFEPRVFTSVQDSGVLLTVRYLTEPRRRRATSEAIWEDILRAFAKYDDIDFAYPTIRTYDNVLEGKEGARAPVIHDQHSAFSAPR
jgi:small-conductance mechanosensitive channel